MFNANELMNCNTGDNNLELYSSLVQVRFAPNKTKLDISYNKLDIRVASRIAERLKTYDLRELGNIRKGWRHCLVPSFPSRN